MGTQTKYIKITPHGNCIACWKCVEACPKHVLRKMNLLVHKHAIVGRNAADCIGCLKCLKTCQHGAFSKCESRKP